MTSVRTHTPCPIEGVFRVLMGPWTPYIIWLLEKEGPLRFGELRARIPDISAKVLTERLRHLETKRLVTRTYYPTIPPIVSYALTERGHELKDVLEGVNDIARRWRTEDAAAGVLSSV